MQVKKLETVIEYYYRAGDKVQRGNDAFAFSRGHGVLSNEAYYNCKNYWYCRWVQLKTIKKVAIK